MVQSGVMCFSAIRAANASWAWFWVADIVSSRIATVLRGQKAEPSVLDAS